jgi:hypothetical protein
MTQLLSSTFPNSSHRDLLTRAQQSLARVPPLCAAAEQCGLDVSAYKQAHQEMHNRVQGYLGVLFPSQPVPSIPSGGVPYA